jgi:predicted lipoprotein with Yx(FWY)xxD motif
MAAAIIIVAGLAAACGSAATTSPPASLGATVPSALPTTAPTSAPAASAPAPSVNAPSAAPSGPVAGASTIVTATVGSRGTLIVAGSNGMTVYTFSDDTADSGTSACTGGCITAWPALTVPAGSTPTAGNGAGGKIGTITRPDDGSLQVTYNGLPLYFFSGDHAKGDSNGVYTGWSTVKP